ncbi:MAG: 50S ribosomal protein L13 [Deltaproteobacteria bacterium]|nr:50S ribosomal protein L13 [Deltaproteobacteria bacterium]MBI2501097.1 50S ribosomal protein L13 [Deltaproteobacteria bacterium]MBI4196830.1 50S ribosomal protein L13 [Deltaproteobacteria bacterium]
MQKTTLTKKEEVTRNWVLIDLANKELGRAATRIANLLRGKHKVTYTPHQDTGDFVIAINAASVKLTGNKEKDKVYYHHTGYIGGIKGITAGELRRKNPAKMIEKAVSGMLPHNKTRKHLLKKLHVYAGSEHPHLAQQPKPLEI